MSIVDDAKNATGSYMYDIVVTATRVNTPSLAYARHGRHQ